MKKIIILLTLILGIVSTNEAIYAGGNAIIPYYSTSSAYYYCINFSNISNDEIRVTIALEDQFGNAYVPSTSDIGVYPTGISFGNAFDLQSHSSGQMCLHASLSGTFGYGTISYELIDSSGQTVIDTAQRMVAHAIWSGAGGNPTNYRLTSIPINSGLPF